MNREIPIHFYTWAFHRTPEKTFTIDMEEHHDFGYALRKEFWHKGIATEADKAVIGYTSLILMVMKIEFIKNIGIPLLYIL